MVQEIAGDLAPHDQALASVENNPESLEGLPRPQSPINNDDPASQAGGRLDAGQEQQQLQQQATYPDDANDVAPPNAYSQPDQPVATTSKSDEAPQLAAAAEATAATTDADTTAYHLKWIFWSNGMIPIVMQSNNGPCPLIAIMNVLLLKEKLKLPSMLEQVTEAQLLAYIGESIMDTVLAPEVRDDESVQLNLEQNIHDAIEILPKLKVGLDVNIRFTGIEDFEYTPQCIIFDLLRIPLYHGWLIDPDMSELQNAVGQQSYNQLIDFVITNRPSQDGVISTRVLLAEEFLDSTASQLTSYGLHQLRTKIKDNEIGILFRNNHFLVIFKREGQIYTLVTDHGYLTEESIVWETLDSIEGAGIFFDANFQLSEITNRQVTEFKAIDQRQQQLANDYLIALSLKEEESKQAVSSEERQQLELSDLEVALRLQAEEDGLAAEEQARRERPRSASAVDRRTVVQASEWHDQQEGRQQPAGQDGATQVLDQQQFPELAASVGMAAVSSTVQDRPSQPERQPPAALEASPAQELPQAPPPSTSGSAVPNSNSATGSVSGNNSNRARVERGKESTCRVQ